MKHSGDDTIAAIVTPPGVGGVGIIRISGRASKSILRSVFKSKKSNISSHVMVHGWIENPKTNENIDEAMACLMESPRSFTGEDVVEFYCHGSPTILQAVLSLVVEQGGRVAERGEFSKRAFLNGKIDLPQAEAILDLVSARTNQGSSYAIQQLKGRLSKRIADIKSELVSILSHNEASIDFSDEVKAKGSIDLRAKISAVTRTIDQAIKGGEIGRLYRQGANIVIVGSPNVGKSSLLNRLLCEERAIISHIPGTTRDTIEETVNINGIPVTLIDTAGVRASQDEIEIAGIKRTMAEAEAADLVVLVFDVSHAFGSDEKLLVEKFCGKDVLIVFNKSDLVISFDPAKILGSDCPAIGIGVSAKTGQGIESLLESIFSSLIKNGKGEKEGSLCINERHRGCLVRASEALQRALNACDNDVPLDLLSIEIKEAILALGEISGELVTDEIINSIFEKFCVGK
ncbi:MAG: tRNA uridine-5-carboxymethylaminomethyl(34) synthesis GTPase MnmE [Candidatus Margulisiibacteriota bacterium]